MEQQEGGRNAPFFFHYMNSLMKKAVKKHEKRDWALQFSPQMNRCERIGLVVWEVQPWALENVFSLPRYKKKGYNANPLNFFCVLHLRKLSWGFFSIINERKMVII